MRYLLLGLLVAALWVSNPNERDFKQFIQHQIAAQQEAQMTGLEGLLVTGLVSAYLENQTYRQDYGVFSVYEVDTGLLQLFDASIPRLRFVGVFGHFIPLEW